MTMAQAGLTLKNADEIEAACLTQDFQAIIFSGLRKFQMPTAETKFFHWNDM